LRVKVRDETLCGAVIAERPAHRVDPRGQGRFGNHPPAPYRLQQIVLSDYPIAVQHKESQKIEGLGLKVDDIGAAAQFAARDVEPVVAKR
jgi:hypothetical protein